ncbi:unnamed protein product, partial [Polarella glacialis]
MLRVATYNIHCGVGNDGAYDLHRIAGVLRRSQADIACLQEVEVNQVARKVRKWSAAHADNQAEMVGRAAGLNQHRFVASLDAFLAEEDGRAYRCCSSEVLVRDRQCQSQYGIAIVSRLRILDSRELHFSCPAPDDDLMFMDREQQPRTAM